MLPRKRFLAASCLVALSSASVSTAAWPQGVYSFDGGGAIFVPGPDGVLRLDTPRGYALHDDVISRRYLDSLPRRKTKSPVHVRRTRTADAVPVQQSAPNEAARPQEDATALRELVAKLNSEVKALRSEVAGLKTEMSKRTAVSQERPEPPQAADAARTDELPKMKEETARLKDETAKLRGEGDALRDRMLKLTTETGALKAGIASLKDELAKRPVVAAKADEPRNDELPKMKQEAARLKDETAKLRNESNTLRDQVAKLSGDTGVLRGEIAALKDELARRPAEPAVTGKIGDPLKKDEPLRKEDALRKSSKDGKFAERPPANKDDLKLPDDREIERVMGFMEKVWRRLIEMVGRTSKDLPSQ